MKETIELRVYEEFARLIFSESEGKRAGSIRVVRIDGNDPRIPQIAALDRKLDAQQKSFYMGWKIKRSYTAAELNSARLFRLIPTTHFEPCGEQCGTVYDDSVSCKVCGAGRRQMSELFLHVARIPKLRDLASTIAYEIVVSQKFVEAVEDARLTGAEFRALGQKKEISQRHRTTARDRSKWYQLVVVSSPVSVLPRTRVGVRPIADEPDNGACPCRDTIGHTVLSELYIESDSWDESDFVATREFVGLRRGLLAPHKLLLTSARARRILEDKSLSGFQTEVAHLNGA